MKIEGSHVFAASRDIVWPIIQDPTVLAGALPGCEQMDLVGDNEYEGTMSVHVGSIKGVFNGRIKLNNIQPGHGFNLEVDGRGPAGFLRGSGHIALAENGHTPHATMTYTGDVQVGGRLTDLSPRMLETSARAVIRQCLEGLDAHVAARTQIHTTTLADAPDPDADAHQPPPHLREAAAGLGALVSILLLLKWIFDRWTNRFAGKVARQVRAELDN